LEFLEYGLIIVRRQKELASGKRRKAMNIIELREIELAQNGPSYSGLVSSKGIDWIARNHDDLKQLRAHAKCPLSKLSDTDYNNFVKELVFAQESLAHVNYKPLMNTLINHRNF
jgi:hypothetical protein